MPAVGEEASEQEGRDGIFTPGHRRLGVWEVGL